MKKFFEMFFPSIAIFGEHYHGPPEAGPGRSTWGRSPATAARAGRRRRQPGAVSAPEDGSQARKTARRGELFSERFIERFFETFRKDPRQAGPGSVPEDGDGSRGRGRAAAPVSAPAARAGRRRRQPGPGPRCCSGLRSGSRAGICYTFRVVITSGQVTWLLHTS